MAFAVNGMLASGGDDNSVRIWDVAARRETDSFELPDRVQSLAFSPDGTKLAIGSSYEKLRMWDVGAGGLRVLSGPEDDAIEVAFSPSGSHVAVNDSDTDSVVIRRTGSNSVLANIADVDGEMAYHPSTQQMAVSRPGG